MKTRILLAGVAAALTLSAGAAQAFVSFVYSGTCTSGCTGAAFGNLTLTEAYVYGAAIDASTFEQFSYESSSGSFSIAFPSLVQGGLNADGSLTGSSLKISDDLRSFSVNGATAQFTSSFGTPVADSLSGGFLPGVRFDPGPVLTAAAAPEPATWAMTILGLGAVGAALRVRRRRGTQALGAGAFTLAC